jgi:uncharacterized membrane protein HdeD (DUF308 family)
MGSCFIMLVEVESALKVSVRWRCTMSSLIQAAGKTIRNCGLALVVLGLLTLFVPRYAGMTIGVLVGIFLVLSGMVRLAFAWAAGSWGSVLFRFAFGVLAIAAGGMMVAQPGTGLRIIIIVAIVYFIADGLSAILFALRLPPAAGGASVLFAGIISLALGVMIWQDWPLPGEQMLGIYIGAKLLADGVVMLIIGKSARAIDRALTAKVTTP